MWHFGVSLLSSQFCPSISGLYLPLPSNPIFPFSFSLSLSVSPQHTWIPLLTTEEQPCQPVQLPRPGARHGLRKRLCGWWAQYLRGERQPSGFPVLATPPRAPLQRRQPDQSRGSTDHAARQWQDALRCRLQWCGVAGWWNFCNNLPCRSPAAWGDLTVSCIILPLPFVFPPEVHFIHTSLFWCW